MSSPIGSKDSGWLFIETQRFTQWWIWIAIVLATCAFVYALFAEGVFNDARNEPGEQAAATLGLVVLLLAIALLAAMHLDVKLNHIGVHYRFFPFHVNFRVKEWPELEKVYTRTYKPVTEFGGWGIRFAFFGKGMAYTVSGNSGLQLEMKNGKRLLIGTQRPDDIERVLKIMRDKKLLPPVS